MNRVDLPTLTSLNGKVHSVKRRRAGMMLVLVVALTTFGFTHWDDLIESLGKIEASSAVIAGITIGMQWCFGAWRDRLLIHRLTTVHVSLRRVFILNSQQYVFNLLPFAAGTFFKAIQYRREMGVPYAKFGAKFLVQYFVLVGVSTAWGVIAAIWLRHWSLVIMFSVILVFTLACLAAPKQFARWCPRFARNKFIETHEGIVLMLSHTRTFLSVVALGVVSHGLQCVRLYVLLHCVDSSIVFSDSVLYAAMAHVSLLLMITPSGLGVREFLFAVVATATDHSVVATVMTSLVERVLALALALLVILLSTLVFNRGRVTGEIDGAEVETK